MGALGTAAAALAVFAAVSTGATLAAWPDETPPQDRGAVYPVKEKILSETDYVPTTEFEEDFSLGAVVIEEVSTGDVRVACAPFRFGLLTVGGGGEVTAAVNEPIDPETAQRYVRRYGTPAPEGPSSARAFVSLADLAEDIIIPSELPGRNAFAANPECQTALEGDALGEKGEVRGGFRLWLITDIVTSGALVIAFDDGGEPVLISPTPPIVIGYKAYELESWLIDDNDKSGGFRTKVKKKANKKTRRRKD